MTPGAPNRVYIQRPIRCRGCANIQAVCPRRRNPGSVAPLRLEAQRRSSGNRGTVASPCRASAPTAPRWPPARRLPRPVSPVEPVAFRSCQPQHPHRISAVAEQPARRNRADGSPVFGAAYDGCSKRCSSRTAAFSAFLRRRSCSSVRSCNPPRSAISATRPQCRAETATKWGLGRVGEDGPDDFQGMFRSYS